MKKSKRAHESVGMDLGDKTSRYYLLNSEREILREGQVAITKAQDAGEVWLVGAGSDRHRSRNELIVANPRLVVLREAALEEYMAEWGPKLRCDPSEALFYEVSLD